jgi:hypothetical protein
MHPSFQLFRDSEAKSMADRGTLVKAGKPDPSRSASDNFCLQSVRLDV